MKPTVPLFLAFLICQGCQRTFEPTDAASPARQGPASSASIPTTDAQPTKTTSQRAGVTATADEIFKTLTAHTWNTDPPGERRGPGPDYSVTTFGADGTWFTQHFTDYPVPARTGKWNLQRGAAGDWSLCRDDGQRHLVILNADGTLTLTFGRLYPAKPLKPDPQWNAKTLPTITLTPQVQQIVERLTVRGWTRTNDLDLRMEPTHIRFSRNWTYVATYRSGACTSKGTWYATAEEISAISHAGRCDDRPGTGGDQLTANVIDDSRILINHDLYVPEDEPTKRGIIWALSGYDGVTAIRIEYDMPIRTAASIRFDVKITNSGNAPLTLERFSLTHSYDNYGRDASEAGKAIVLPMEMAGKDLQRVDLAPGKSHAFALSTTFPEAGTQWLYFNALITGASQNWDTHSAYEVTVRE